ncbi:MAG: hypothetical protein AB7P08_18245 [Burkholderiales bacterium]
MQLTITSVDYAPGDLYDQVPLVVDLIREIPGDDRPDYWLGSLRAPIRWLVDNHIREVTHLVLAARWQGTAIATGAENLPVGIAYVTDQSVLNDAHLSLGKCAYVAIGISTETGGGAQPTPLKNILSGTIARGFGTGKPT